MALFLTLAYNSAIAQDTDPSRVLFTNVNVFNGTSDSVKSQDVLDLTRHSHWLQPRS